MCFTSYLVKASLLIDPPNDFWQQELRVGYTYGAEPASERYAKPDGSMEAKGSCISLVHYLAEALNFKIRYDYNAYAKPMHANDNFHRFFPSVDGAWGAQLDDGTWTGVIGMIARDVSSLIRLPQRCLVHQWSNSILFLRKLIWPLELSVSHILAVESYLIAGPTLKKNLAWLVISLDCCPSGRPSSGLFSGQFGWPSVCQWCCFHLSFWYLWRCLKNTKLRARARASTLYSIASGHPCRAFVLKVIPISYFSDSLGNWANTIFLFQCMMHGQKGGALKSYCCPGPSSALCLLQVETSV